MANSQSDGKNNLKRIEFAINGKAYKFILNPEEYQQSEPNIVTPNMTKGGAWTDEFGAGIVTIQFKGTTGFKNGTSDPTSGFSKFKELQEYIRDVYNRVTPGAVIPLSKELYFYNYTDGEYWAVTPITFDLSRSVARPLMYVYNIQLICNRYLGDPNPADISSAEDITEDTLVVDLTDYGVGTEVINLSE